VLIGNGTGLAGLRSHLRARAVAGLGPNWLLFGERNTAHDRLYGDELQAWHDGGVLQRLDLAFSRDRAEGAPRAYVQDLLAQSGDLLRQWVEQGAAIYVCGSLQGMAQGVDQALHALLGQAQVEQLVRSGRYRRDVY
jgi:sulfite reductase (NADPH) flavoprotein alpha-component